MVEQIIRPTGLVDPTITSPPPWQDRSTRRSGTAPPPAGRAQGAEKGHYSNQKTAEDLSEYLRGNGLKVRYLHLTLTRSSGWRFSASCARRSFDILVGINLKREGLDLPRGLLVCILDADKEDSSATRPR